MMTKPPGETRSITQIEYDEATRRKVPRLIFLKDQREIRYDDTDAVKGLPMDRVERFRAQVSSGGPDDPRPAVFGSVNDLKLERQRTAIFAASSDWRWFW